MTSMFLFLPFEEVEIVIHKFAFKHNDPPFSLLHGICMSQLNYHTHSHYCDGKGELAEYVETAIAKGFTHLGFSGHAPVPFENTFAIKHDDYKAYCDEVRRTATRCGGLRWVAAGWVAQKMVARPSQERGGEELGRQPSGKRWVAVEGVSR